MNCTSNLPNDFYSPDQLKALLRLLSTQNSMWTRNYIVSYIANLDDVIVLDNRVLMNVIDIKNVFSVYYTDEISSNLESLLRNYISRLSDVLKLLKINYANPTITSQKDLMLAQRYWDNSAVEIAQFLSEINPNWSLDQLQTLILDHIEMTRNQMIKRLQSDYTFEIHQYDFLEYHSLMIADYIYEGIINMFY